MTDLNQSVTVELITPEMAQELLTANTKNRPASARNLDRIKAAMMAGQFHFTGDAIRIGEDGVLYDGQHRLMAAVATGCTFKSIVIRNLAADALLVIDGGLKRSTQQQLQMATGTAKHVTDTVLMLTRFAIGAKYSLTSTDDIAMILAKHPIIRDVADAYIDAPKLRLGANIPAAELVMRAHGYHERANEWRKVWVEGLMPSGADVAHKFRERLIVNPELPRNGQMSVNDARDILGNVILRHLHPSGATPKHWKRPKPPFRFPAFTVDNLKTEVDFHRAEKAPYNAISNTDMHNKTTNRADYDSRKYQKNAEHYRQAKSRNTAARRQRIEALRKQAQLPLNDAAYHEAAKQKLAELGLDDDNAILRYNALVDANPDKDDDEIIILFNAEVDAIWQRAENSVPAPEQPEG